MTAVRVLVATTAGSGHFGPLVPFANALSDADHEVAVAAPDSFRTAVERAGFVHLPFADAPPEELGAVFASLGGKSNAEGNAIVVREVFGRLDTGAALPGMVMIFEDWQPDLVLREQTEFASYMVAERAGVPHVHVTVGLSSFDQNFIPLVDEPLKTLGFGPGISGAMSSPRFSLLPPSFEDPTAPGPPAMRRFRDPGAGVAPSSTSIPDWWPGFSAPLVYVTFGSVAGGLGLFPDFYAAVAAELADEPVRVLLTIGEAGDPAALGPLGANVHVERWWPQQALMPHTSAVIGHGGLGTTLLALAGGVPQVVVPLFADQPDNARRVAAVGAGVALEGGREAVGELRSALRQVLADSSYRAGAQRIAEEIADLPPASEAVPYLEKLAGRPGRRISRPDGAT
jgi:UDP:flavonoid glycosyltransferase YjiC (YdhE family)